MWSAEFKQDTEVDGVGTVTATYVDARDAFVCAHSGRVDTNTGKGLDDFLIECNTALQKATAHQTKTDAVVAKIVAKLNG